MQDLRHKHEKQKARQISPKCILFKFRKIGRVKLMSFLKLLTPSNGMIQGQAAANGCKRKRSALEYAIGRFGTMILSDTKRRVSLFTEDT